MVHKFILAIISLTAISSTAFTQTTVVPKAIYHNGVYGYLVEDQRIQNLPANIWTGILDGSKNHYPIYRRGLYAVTHPNRALWYQYKHILGRDDLPWFMEVRIKDSCRSAKTYLDIADLPNDPRFQTLLAEHLVAFSTSDDFFQKCFGGKFQWDEYGGLFFDDDRTWGGESKCSQAVAMYIETYGIRVLRDRQWRNSWYIRDPTCVEGIQATPDQILELITKFPDYWMRKAENIATDDTGFSIDGLSRFEILVTSLSRGKHVRPETLQKVVNSAVLSDIRIEKCPLPEFQTFWVAKAVPKLIETASRCRSRSQFTIFQTGSEKFLAFMSTHLKADEKPTSNEEMSLKLMNKVSEFLRQLDQLCTNKEQISLDTR